MEGHVMTIFSANRCLKINRYLISKETAHLYRRSVRYDIVIVIADDGRLIRGFVR